MRFARLGEGVPGSPIVILSLRDQAAERLREATARHVLERVGILLNGEPFAAPLIQESISEMYLANAFTEGHCA